jgi:hypothetical protein
MIIELALNATYFPAGGGGKGQGGKDAPQKKQILIKKYRCSRVIASGQRSSLFPYGI